VNQAIYDAAVKRGCTPKMAEMLACRKMPGLRTDTAYFAQFKPLADELGDGYAENVIRDAQKHGYNPSTGDVYMPGLADFRGDPRAFFSRTEGSGAIKKRIEERGTGCEGKWSIPAREPESDPLAPENCVALAPDLVDQRIAVMTRENPDVAHENQVELRKQIVKKHGRQNKTPKPLRKEK
jgi:hypothetical protein